MAWRCGPMAGRRGDAANPPLLTHFRSWFLEGNYSGPAGIGSQGLLSNRRRSTPSTSIPCFRAVEM
jgi:hypothetical protein